MRRVRVLIVDDSSIYRANIRLALEMPWIEIVGTASNGKIALDKVSILDPDLLILDLEMPEVDGLVTLGELKRRGSRCRTVVFSSASKKGSEAALSALALGALDFVKKPDARLEDLHDASPSQKIRSLLLPRIEAIWNKDEVEKQEDVPTVASSYDPIEWSTFRPRILVIGASTGGPTVLEKIFSELRGPFAVPIVITQHMPPVFTATFAERLAKICRGEASEARDGEPLLPNKLYVAPGDFHLTIIGSMESPILRLDRSEKVNSVRPAVDKLFVSAARVYRKHCLGVILTGMGSDGKVGSASIKENGGAILIQDQESCIVFGMPGSVFQNGSFDKIGSPDVLISLLRDKILGFPAIEKAG